MESEVRDALWLAIRDALEIQLMNAEDVPASLLDDERLGRIADGVRDYLERKGVCREQSV